MGIPKSIVLVDDDRDDHEIFRSACMQVDHRTNVLGFENGDQAIRNLSVMQALPYVIFLDLNMPRQNGVDVLEKLKDSAQLKSVPVVIYSTSFDSQVREKCSSLGAIEIMEKPSCFDALCRRLQTVLHAL
jgi:CheY-like chemotaxis protein